MIFLYIYIYVCVHIVSHPKLQSQQFNDEYPSIADEIIL